MEPQKVRDYLCLLQDTICDAIQNIEPTAIFDKRELQGRGVARPRVLSNGTHIEKAAVNFTHSIGAALPKAATANRSHLSGRPFQAVSLSLIIHPRNPFAPTTHANIEAPMREQKQTPPKQTVQNTSLIDTTRTQNTDTT